MLKWYDDSIPWRVSVQFGVSSQKAYVAVYCDLYHAMFEP